MKAALWSALAFMGTSLLITFVVRLTFALLGRAMTDGAAEFTVFMANGLGVMAAIAALVAMPEKP